ncbi:hypothetical protein ACFWPK_04215 [Nocardia sp. NPDC058519]|uniref:hypothetical protein n=1 Tax=Nocardia sp. NPDC058519 TaxID=3346535 RepID=UPI003652F4A4
MATHDPINTSEARVLAVLAPGGMLTADQIARNANLARRRAAQAAGRMSMLGLIGCRPTNHGDVWEMTPRGRGWAATSIGRATLDVPGFKVAR